VVDLVSEQIDKLGEYRQALITAAVTGKIDIRGEGGYPPPPDAARAGEVGEEEAESS
jgi:hypothetical protein